MTPETLEHFDTAEEFERWYAVNSKVTVSFLHKNGRYGKSCDCKEDGCTGWQMAHKHDA